MGGERTLRVQRAGIDQNAIGQRAYDIFVSRGYAHGHDLDDWLAAEAQLREKLAAKGKSVRRTARARSSRLRKKAS
jgi:hypothetical protein